LTDPEIASEVEPGQFIDLLFRIKEHRSGPDGSSSITASGVHKHEQVEFAVDLGPSWDQGSIGNLDRTVYRGEVTLRPSGAGSDRFLRVLGEFYGAAPVQRHMAAATRFAVMSLKGDPRHLEQGPIMLKLFFENDDPKRYAEVYLNIDVAQGRLELNEKDPDYRRPILEALSREP